MRVLVTVAVNHSCFWQLGDAREPVRVRVSQIVQTLPKVYAYSRVFQLLLEHGLVAVQLGVALPVETQQLLPIYELSPSAQSPYDSGTTNLYLHNVVYIRAAMQSAWMGCSGYGCMIAHLS